MKDGPKIATVAALLGDPARANMLGALMDGRSLTASELAGAAGVTLQTASSHLSKLDSAGLIDRSRQGRHHYFQLSGSDVADVLERLMGLAARTGATPTRTGPNDAALRHARICYDHLAGECGVGLLDASRREGLIEGEDMLALTEKGRAFFTGFGLDLTRLEDGRRPVCRACLDWSERRSHLAGALGAAILQATVERGWLRRGPGRVMSFSPDGLRRFRAAFALG